VTVLGLGLFGGGEGAARYLAERGARVTVTDLKTAEELAPTLERLKGLPIRYQFGAHGLDELTRADLVVANPAVPRGSELLRACRAEGVPLSSPMNLFLALCRAPIAAVTGSVGKSTTAAMLAAMLRVAGRETYLGGNIGRSLLPELDRITPSAAVVLELSSFQLEDAAHLPWSPHLAVVTNVCPNHLDRYNGVASYAEAKRNIVAFQGPADLVVLNAADPTLRRWREDGLPGRVLLFGGAEGEGASHDGVVLRGGRLVWSCGGHRQVICARSDIALPGHHNTLNAMAAAAAAMQLGAKAEHVREALSSFRPLEHRLELADSFGGMTFYNDSDSTTPDSTIAALDTFDGPLTLIAGGANKNLDMEPLGKAVARKADVLITLGRAGPLIARCAREAALREGRHLTVREAACLEEAVELSLELSMPGSTVLFSPACASFDMFQNFAERGRRFKQHVAELEQRWRASGSAAR